jgi:hypothetical protein
MQYSQRMIQRIAACCALALASLAAHAQQESVVMDAIVKGKVAGTATHTRVLQPDGSMTMRTVLQITETSGKVTIDITSTSDRTATPVSKKVTVTGNGQTVSFTAKLSNAGAEVTAANGKTQTVPLVSKATRTDVTDRWFIKVQPKPGQKATTQSFEPFAMKWAVVTTTYVGRRPLTIAGKKVTAHLLKQTRDGQTSTIWLDNRGMPLRGEEPNLTMVKK